MKLSQLGSVVEELITPGKPTVIFGAVWPFLRVLDVPKAELPLSILQTLSASIGLRGDILMPTFAGGYKDGLCNLDAEPSTTGIITELFRRDPKSARSLSAFFSFSIQGPSSEELLSLRPENAWGDGSVYDWMEQKDVTILTFGIHPTHNSYMHRMEWLAKEKINYRYPKTFHGTLISKGQKVPMAETLYVRSLNPPLENDFTVILESLQRNGMKVLQIDGINFSAISTRKVRETFLPLLLADPYLTIKNRHLFETGKL